MRALLQVRLWVRRGARQVLVKIADKRTGGIFRGRGVSTDIIKGSILALLSAINKIEAPLAP